MDSFKMGDTVSVPRYKEKGFIEGGKYIFCKGEDKPFYIETISGNRQVDYTAIPQSEFLPCRLLLIEKGIKFPNFIN